MNSSTYHVTVLPDRIQYFAFFFWNICFVLTMKYLIHFKGNFITDNIRFKIVFIYRIRSECVCAQSGV